MRFSFALASFALLQTTDVGTAAAGNWAPADRPVRPSAGAYTRCKYGKAREEIYSGRVSSAELPLADQRGLTADALLAGPRGRSLCANLLDDRLASPGRPVPGAWPDVLHAVRTGDTVRGASKLRECVGVAGLPGTPFDGSALLAGLQAAVDLAMYWQEPDAEDRGFAGEAAR
jgi:hypothetical protein